MDRPRPAGLHGRAVRAGIGSEAGVPMTPDGERDLTSKDAAGGPESHPSDSLWYKDAIIYEAHVRAFFDSDGNGVGDFPGLTQKLDYLSDLGITTLWLLPFYPSPLP